MATTDHPTNVLQALLSGDSIPDPIQTATLRQGIDDATQQIPLVRRQLQELEDKLLRYRWALSPLRRLPLETIGEIIYLAAPDFRERGARRELFNYVLVCKSWWHASLLKHHLWNIVHIHGPIYHDLERQGGKPIFRKGSFSKIAAWLDRAGSLPRTLEVVGSNDYRDSVCKGHEVTDIGGVQCVWLAPTMRKLLVRGSQLDTLSLARIRPACLRLLMESIRSSKYSGIRALSELTSLNIVFAYDRCRWSESTVALQDPFALFSHLPHHLTTLRLSLPSVHGIGFDQFANPLQIPAEVLAGLKTFEFNSDWDILHAPRLLQACENLEFLSLNFRGRDPMFANYDEEHLFEVYLPNLRTLRVQNQYFEFEILKFFRTPALEELDLGYDRILFRHNIAVQNIPAAALSPRIPLCNFAVYSGCQDTLRSLRIHGFTAPSGLPAEDFEAISVAFPSLTRLTLDKVIIDAQELFTAFQRKLAGCDTPNSIPPSCFPRLRQLDLLTCPEKHYGSQSLFAFLRRLHHARGGGESERIELLMSFAERSGWEELDEDDFFEIRGLGRDYAQEEAKRDSVLFKIVEAEDGNKNWADPNDDGVRAHPFARPLDLDTIQFATFTPMNN